MSNQIPVYYIRGYPFNPPHVRDEFYPWIPVGMGIFATPTLYIKGPDSFYYENALSNNLKILKEEF